MSQLSLLPGAGVGYLRLGAALYDVITALKADAKRFSRLDISFSPSDPLRLPVIVTLPNNGLRLRFDGPQQRLRLIEILDPTKDNYTVKNDRLIPTSEHSHQAALAYRRVYQLFGASYPGEFIPPADTAPEGTYVVSYPGIALSFPLSPSIWSPQVDHAKMLAECGAKVSSIAVFDGKSWAEARKDLFTRPLTSPQSLNGIVKPKEGLPDEIVLVQIQDRNRLTFLRRTNDPVIITLGASSAQDLITDFGPPESIFRRAQEMPDVSSRPNRTTGRRSSSVVPRSWGSTPSSLSSTNTDTYDADFEEDDGAEGPDVVRLEEQYYCYFHHGFDVLLGHPSGRAGGNAQAQLLVTRIILHGNVPGSFEFNRHRRSRWCLDRLDPQITSESNFNGVHPQLMARFKDTWPEKEMREGMVIVRDWAGESPSGSAILIGEGADGEEEEAEQGGEQWLKNTQLYKFPGLMFEVMHTGAVSALTVHEYE